MRIFIPNRGINPYKKISVYDRYITDQAVTVLELVNFGQEFHVLPQRGGLLDQDSLFVYLLREVFRFREDKRKLDERKTSSSIPRH